MPENAILALEEALLASLFTQRALVELLIKKKIISREELEKEILRTETESIGAGVAGKRIFLEKRKKKRNSKKK